MKKIFIFLTIALIYLFPQNVFAAPPYPLELTAGDSTITVKMIGAAGNTNSFGIIGLTKDAFPTQFSATEALNLMQNNAIYSFTDSNLLTPLDRLRKVDASGATSWTFIARPDTQYYIKIYEMRPLSVAGNTLYVPTPVTNTATIASKSLSAVNLAWPTAVEINDERVKISGKIDIKKHPYFEQFKIKFEFSKTAFDPADTKYDTIPFTEAKFGNLQKVGYEAAWGVFTGVHSVAVYKDISDGTYSGEVYNNLLTPNTQWFVRQTITLGGKVIDVRTDKFNSTKGYTPTGSAAEQNNFEKRSYRLLAPWPGLAVLMDPSLCAEQQAAGTLSPNAICDINTFLNYLFKLLIGLTAVGLVLRLIYEGYQLITTDIPYLHAKAKSEFFSALFGLILALSAYLILNTINPKLVANDINLATVSVGVEDYSTIDDATYQKLTGQTVKAKPETLKLVETLSTQNSIDACIVKAAITIESNWRSNVIGCDENAPYSDVPSRKAFVGSGIKYDGTTFTPTTYDNSIRNNCPKTLDVSKPGYGLDWRFSKGGGLMQKTLFPDGYKTQVWYEGVKQGGTYWNKRTIPFTGWEKIIIPEQNIKSGIDILKNGLSKCGTVEGAYRAYGSGNCNGSGQLLNSSVAKKVSEYNRCKAGAADYKS